MATGSMRRRGRDAWQLRVYLGTDAQTRRPRWLSKTIHGTGRFARRALEDLVAEAVRARIPARSRIRSNSRSKGRKPV
jgi:hypothetical protein